MDDDDGLQVASEAESRAGLGSTRAARTSTSARWPATWRRGGSRSTCSPAATAPTCPTSSTGARAPIERGELERYFDEYRDGPGIWKWLHYFDVYERYLEQFRTTIAELGELPAESLSPRVRTDLLAAFRDWHHG